MQLLSMRVEMQADMQAKLDAALKDKPAPPTVVHSVPQQGGGMFTPLRTSTNKSLNFSQPTTVKKSYTLRPATQNPFPYSPHSPMTTAPFTPRVAKTLIPGLSPINETPMVNLTSPIQPMGGAQIPAPSPLTPANAPSAPSPPPANPSAPSPSFSATIPSSYQKLYPTSNRIEVKENPRPPLNTNHPIAGGVGGMDKMKWEHIKENIWKAAQYFQLEGALLNSRPADGHYEEILNADGITTREVHFPQEAEKLIQSRVGFDAGDLVQIRHYVSYRNSSGRLESNLERAYRIKFTHMLLDFCKGTSAEYLFHINSAIPWGDLRSYYLALKQLSFKSNGDTRAKARNDFTALSSRNDKSFLVFLNVWLKVMAQCQLEGVTIDNVSQIDTLLKVGRRLPDIKWRINKLARKRSEGAPDPEPQALINQLSQDAFISRANNPAGHAQISNVETSSRPCRFNPKGTCHRGDKCSFSHTGKGAREKSAQSGHSSNNARAQKKDQNPNSKREHTYSKAEIAKLPCYYCGKLGHLRPDCRSLEQDKKNNCVKPNKIASPHAKKKREDKESNARQSAQTKKVADSSFASMKTDAQFQNMMINAIRATISPHALIAQPPTPAQTSERRMVPSKPPAQPSSTGSQPSAHTSMLICDPLRGPSGSPHDDIEEEVKYAEVRCVEADCDYCDPDSKISLRAQIMDAQDAAPAHEVALRAQIMDAQDAAPAHEIASRAQMDAQYSAPARKSSRARMDSSTAHGAPRRSRPAQINSSSFFSVFTTLVLMLVASWTFPHASAESTVKFDQDLTSIVPDALRSPLCGETLYDDGARSSAADQPRGIDPQWMIDQMNTSGAQSPHEYRAKIPRTKNPAMQPLHWDIVGDDSLPSCGFIVSTGGGSTFCTTYHGEKITALLRKPSKGVQLLSADVLRKISQQGARDQDFPMYTGAHVYQTLPAGDDVRRSLRDAEVTPDATVTPPFSYSRLSFQIAEANAATTNDDETEFDPHVLRSMVDSGATHSICNDKRYFIKNTMRPTQIRVRSAMAGQNTTAGSIGEISLCCDNGETIILRDVLYCPNSRHNIISVPQLDKSGYNVTFRKNKCVIGHGRKTHIQRERSADDGLYFVNLVVNTRPLRSTARSLPEALSVDAISDINAAMCTSNDNENVCSLRCLFEYPSDATSNNIDVHPGGGLATRWRIPSGVPEKPSECYRGIGDENVTETSRLTTSEHITNTIISRAPPDITISQANLAQTYRGNQSEYDLYHQRMIHVHDGAMRKAYPKVKIPDKCACPACVNGKMHQFPFKSIGEKIPCKPGEIIDSDLAGPFVNSRRHYRYRAVYIDQATDYVMSILLPVKSQQEAAWNWLYNWVKTQTGNSPKIHHADLGGEYVSKTSYNTALKQGLQKRFAAPGASNQNPIAERKNRTLDEAISTIMHNAGAPSTFWGLANEHVVFTHNHLPYRKLQDPNDENKWEWQSRAQLFLSTERKFDVNDLRVWGCEMWGYVPVKRRTGAKNHLRLKTRHGIFVGYDKTSKAYLIYDITARKIFKAARQHTVANESVFPWRDKKNKTQDEANLPPSFQLPSRELLTPDLVKMYFEDIDELPPKPSEKVVYDPGASLLEDDEEAGHRHVFSYEEYMEGMPDIANDDVEKLPEVRKTLWDDPLAKNPITEENFEELAPNDEPLLSPARKSAQVPEVPRAPTHHNTWLRTALVTESPPVATRAMDPPLPPRRTTRERAPSAQLRYNVATNAVMVNPPPTSHVSHPVPPAEQGGAMTMSPDSQQTALRTARNPIGAYNRSSTKLLDRSDVTSEAIGAVVNNVEVTFSEEPTKTGYGQGAATTQAVPMSKNQLLDPEPRNRREAQASRFWNCYFAAEKVEFEALKRNGTFSLIKKSDMPKYAKLLKHKWVYKDKKDDDGVVNGAKARLTAMGCGQREGLDYNETYASTMNIRTFRAALAIFNLDPSLQMLHWDVSNAYLHAKLKEDIYITQPTGHELPGKDGYVYKLDKSLYGLKQAGREWQHYLRDILVNDCGFEVLKADEACYMKRDGDSWIMMCTFVDDIFPLTNNPKMLENVFAQLCKKCTIKNLGNVTCALRTNIEYDRKEGVLKLSNAPYIKEIIKRFGMENCKIAHTPMDPNNPLSPEDWPKSEEEKAAIMRKYPFRELLGCLWWPTWMSRPDILVAVHEASKHVDKPSEKLWNHLVRIVRYLAHTDSLGVVMKRPEAPSAHTYINAFVDGDWGACLKSRKSRTGGLIEVHGQLIIWFSAMQTATALSTSESEFYGIVTISKVLLWLRNVMEIIYKPVDAPIPIWCDNQAAIAWSYDLPFAKRAKHLDLRLHVMKEWTAHKTVKPDYMPGDIMPADFLTKPLDRERFERLRDRVMGPPELQKFFSPSPPSPKSNILTPLEEAKVAFLSALRCAYDASSCADLPNVAHCATLFAHEILTNSQAGMINGAANELPIHASSLLS